MIIYLSSSSLRKDNGGFFMELRKIRFNQSWGMACGPVCGDSSVECMFYDDEGHSFFIYASTLDSGLFITVSKYSVFDLMNNDGGDFDFEFAKVKKVSLKYGDYDIYDNDEIGEFFDDFGTFHKAVMVTLNVLQSYLGCDDTDAISRTWTCKDIKDLDCSYHSFYLDEEDGSVEEN